MSRGPMKLPMYLGGIDKNQNWKNLGFLKKTFSGFQVLGFLKFLKFLRFQCRPANKTGHQIPTLEVYILILYYTLFSLAVTSFSINHNKTYKSRLKHEIKYDLYKILPKNKNLEKPKFWTFEVFWFFKPKKPSFFRTHFPALTEMLPCRTKKRSISEEPANDVFDAQRDQVDASSAHRWTWVKLMTRPKLVVQRRRRYCYQSKTQDYPDWRIRTVLGLQGPAPQATSLGYIILYILFVNSIVVFLNMILF